MNQREELQKLLNTVDEKIIRLRVAKVIETDTSVKFKLEKQIEEAQAEREHIKQEIENQNTSAASCCLYRALLKLGYREQVRLFRRILQAKSKIAAFLLHGSPDYGQRWLLNRLITHNIRYGTVGNQNIRYGTVGKLVRVQLNRIGRRGDISALWRELGGRVGLVGRQHTPSEIVERVYGWWQTQNVILVFHDIDCMPPEYLLEFIEKFWSSLANQAQEVISETYKYQLLMFLVDYEGYLGTRETLFMEKLEPTWKPKIPIKLPLIARFCDHTLKDWIEKIEEDMEFDTLPLVEAIGDELIQEILDNSENGVPELAMSEICHLCGCNWYEEKDRWLKY